MISNALAALLPALNEAQMNLRVPSRSRSALWLVLHWYLLHLDRACPEVFMVQMELDMRAVWLRIFLLSTHGYPRLCQWLPSHALSEL